MKAQKIAQKVLVAISEIHGVMADNLASAVMSGLFGLDAGNEEHLVAVDARGVGTAGNPWEVEANGETWIGFRSFEDAATYAVDEAGDIALDALSTKDLAEHVYITETNIRQLANDEAEYTVDNMSDEMALKFTGNDEVANELEEDIDSLEDEIVALEGQDGTKGQIKELEKEIKIIRQEIEDLPDVARDEALSKVHGEWKSGLESDPSKFLVSTGRYTVEELMEESFIRIDPVSASQAYVQAKGVNGVLEASAKKGVGDTRWYKV